MAIDRTRFSGETMQGSVGTRPNTGNQPFNDWTLLSTSLEDYTMTVHVLHVDWHSCPSEYWCQPEVMRHKASIQLCTPQYFKHCCLMSIMCKDICFSS